MDQGRADWYCMRPGFTFDARIYIRLEANLPYCMAVVLTERMGESLRSDVHTPTRSAHEI